MSVQQSEATKLRGEIRRVGTVDTMPPNPLGHEWAIVNWHIAGGDYPGLITGRPAILCGWGVAELALIAQLAAHTSEAEAIQFANSLRSIFTNLWMESRDGDV